MLTAYSKAKLTGEMMYVTLRKEKNAMLLVGALSYHAQLVDSYFD